MQHTISQCTEQVINIQCCHCMKTVLSKQNFIMLHYVIATLHCEGIAIVLKVQETCVSRVSENLENSKKIQEIQGTPYGLPW